MPVLSALLLALLSAASTPADGFATVRVPAGQAAVVTLSLSPATAKLLGDTASVWLVGPTGVREVPSQYDAPDDGPTHLCWLRDDPATDETYRIRADAPSPGLEPPHRVTVQRESDALVVDTGALRLRHPLTAGGLPSSFSLPSLPAPVALSWSDRLYHFGLGGFNLTGDPSPEVQVRTAGPLRAEVQVSARYLAGDAPAPGRPHAVYTFAYTAASPVVELSVHVLSPADQVWHELHIAQLCGLPFQRFHAGEGCEPMPLTGRDYPVSNPSVLIGTGPTATVGLIQDPTANRSPDDFLAFWDPALPSDREAREGIVRTYVRGPWLGAWRGEYTHDLSIVFGPPNLPAAEARRLVRAVLSPTELSVSTPALEQALASVEDAVASAKPPGPDAGTSGARRDATSPAAWWWKAYLGGIAARGSGRARRMASRGCLVEAEEAARSTAERLARLARQAPRVQESSDAAAWAARSSGLLVLGSSRCATAIDLRRPPAIASLVARHGTQDLASAERRVPVLRVKLRRVDGSDFETATRDLRLESVTASISDEGVTGEIALRGLPEPGITLRATVAYHIARDGDATAWRASATADGATLLWLRFPDVAVAPVGGPEALGQQVVITPRALGTNLIPRPAESFSLAERQPFGDMWQPETMMYPNLSLPLQMTCTYRARYAPTGPPRLTAAGSPDTPDLLYFATEDPLCYYKAFQYVSIQDDELGPGLRGAFIHVPEAAASCHSYSTPYATVLAPLRGDWFDAAMRYRAWAVRQPWCSRGPLRTRADQPDWIKAVPVWYLASDLGDEHVKALSDNADFLGLPIAAHWYDWHHNPFDSRVPDYFPPRRGDGQFHRDIAEWRRRGIFPVPYIQGLGWDLLGESYAAEGAAAGVCLAEDGTPPYTVYCKGTPDECHMASMCLASSFWQDKLAAIVGKLADYGVAGVYLDSIGCGAQACYAPDHGHPPGPGGHYWSDAVRELLARLHRIEDPDGERLVFTTEGFTECGLDSFDAYLPHLHHPRPDEPCVYDAVYHDYTSFHGCFTGWRYAPDGTLSRAAATCFALGRPLGWFYHGFHNDAYLTPEARPEMDFLRELAHARVALADFLALGAMLPPPSVIEEGDDPRGSVLASAWRAGDEVLVVAVNHADEAVSFRVGLERLGPGATLEPFWPRDDPQPGVLSTGGLSGALRLGPRALRAWRGPARAAR